MAKPEIIVVGAGVVGCSLAFHLARSGARVTVFDKAGEVSANIAANEYNPAAPVPVYLAQPRTVGLSINYKYN